MIQKSVRIRKVERFKITILLTIALFLVFQVSAQTSALGKVYGEGKPLEDVTVTIDEIPNITTKTDLYGNFTIENLQSQKYTLRFVRAGFLSAEETIDLRKKSTLNVSVDLKLDPMMFEEVAVVGEKIGLTERTPYNVSRLDAKNVALKGQASGIMGLIQQEPGVNAAEMGHGIVKPFIRGLGFSRVVTIYQGNKLENHQWGADHGLGLNDLGIASVDVIKGPASILYGSGALGGVLIMNDEKFYTLDNQLRGVIGTTMNTVSGGARGYGTLGKKLENGIFFALEGAYENHADYFDGDNRLIGNSRFNTKTGRLHLGYQGEQFNNKLSYSLNEQFLGIINDDEMEDGESLATNRSDRAMQLPFQRVEDHLISYRQQYRINEAWKKEMDVTYHYNQREEIEDNFNDIDLGLQQHHVFYNLRFNNKLTKKYTQTFGVQGSRIDMRNMLVAEEILFPNASYFENGLYYLGTYTKGKHTFQGGLRGDYRPMLANANQENIVEQGYVLPGNPADRTLNLDFLGFTGSLGYSIEINDKNLFKINASSGFRSPDLAELLSNGPHPGTNRFEIGNINFSNEQSFQGDISWLYASEKLSFNVGVFTNYINNYIFFADSEDTTANGLTVWEFRQTDALLLGGEMSIKYKPFSNNKLTVDVFGNMTRGMDLVNEEHLTFIPADRIGTQVSYHPLKTNVLEFFVRNQFVFLQDRPGFGEEITSAYNLFDIGLNYQVKLGSQKLNIGLTAFNLLNQTYFDHISLLRAFEVTAPGRNLLLNIQWKF